MSLFNRHTPVVPRTSASAPAHAPTRSPARLHLGWMSRVHARIIESAEDRSVQLEVVPWGRRDDSVPPRTLTTERASLDLFDPPSPLPLPGEWLPWPLRVVREAPLDVADRRPVRQHPDGGWEVILCVDGPVDDNSTVLVDLGGQRRHGPFRVPGGQLAALSGARGVELPMCGQRRLYQLRMRETLDLDSANPALGLDRHLDAHLGDGLIDAWLVKHAVPNSLVVAPQRRQEALERDREEMMRGLGEGTKP